MAIQKLSSLKKAARALAAFGVLGLGGSFAAAAILDAKYAPKKTHWDHLDLSCDGATATAVARAEHARRRPLTPMEKRDFALARTYHLTDVTVWEEKRRSAFPVSIQRGAHRPEPLAPNCRIARQWDFMWTKK